MIYREPGKVTTTVDVDLLKRVHRVLYGIGSIRAGLWDEVDALKQEVARAVVSAGSSVDSEEQ